MGIIRGDYLLGLGAGKMLLATLVLLNLGPLACAALPSFLANLEEGLTYHKCDSSMCWWTNFDIEFVTDLRVPNSSLVIADYDWNWWEVKMSSLLEECAPSLPLSQVAYSFSACEDIDNSSIEEACIGVQRDWLDERGGQKRKTRKGKKNGKKIKTEKSKKQKKQKGKARKEKEKTKKGKKKNKSGKQTTSKKKRKEAKRALKKIGLKKVPTELVLAQLKCIWLAVDLALEDCGREVLKNSNI